MTTTHEDDAATTSLPSMDDHHDVARVDPDHDASSRETSRSVDRTRPRATRDDDIDAHPQDVSAVDDKARLARRLLELATMPLDEDGWPLGETLTESEYWALQELAGDVTEIADRWVAQWAASNRARAEAELEASLLE